MAKQRILITGGAGFLGCALAEQLRAEAQVVLFDALCHDPRLQRQRASQLGLELIEADVTDAAALAKALAGCQRVVHLASLAGVERVCADPVTTMRTILLGTAHLLEACCRLGGIARLVLVSSSEVYGPQADRPAEDSVAIGLPAGPARWTYAAAKLAAEHLGLATWRQSGLPVTVVRPFNVYGPGQLGRGAVATFVARALAGQPLVLAGGGASVRAWCHVDDLLPGLRAALFEPAAAGRVYNLGNPAATASTRRLAELVVRLSGSASPLIDGPAPEAEVHVRVPEIGRARRELGFAPRIGLEQGLGQTIASLRRAHPDASSGLAAGSSPCDAS